MFNITQKLNSFKETDVQDSIRFLEKIKRLLRCIATRQNIFENVLIYEYVNINSPITKINYNYF